MKNMFFLIAMAVLSILSIVLSTWYNIKEAREAKKENDSLQSAIHANSKITREQSDIIEDLRRLNEDLRKEITGNGNMPVLLMTTNLHSKPNLKYFVVNFSLLNESEYPLLNLRGNINDALGGNMFNYELYYFMDGNVIRSIKPSSKDKANWKPSKQFNIGTLNKTKQIQFYITAIGMGDFTKNSYWIDVQWSRGTIHYIIDLAVKSETIKIESAQITFDNKILSQDYQNFLRFN